MIIIDNMNGDANHFGNEGSFVSNVHFGGYDAYDVAVFDDDHVGVSNPKRQTISFINVSRSKVTKSLPTGL